MATKIRFMTQEDKPAIMKILSVTREFKPAEVMVAEELIDSYLLDPKGSGYHVLVAEVDATIAGYICYGSTPLTEATWDLYWQAVAPQLQGLGIGGALMVAAEDKIREAGGMLAIIETSSTPDYEKTLRFHCHQGYKEICQIPDFYAPGDGKVILYKRLR